MDSTEEPGPSASPPPPVSPSRERIFNGSSFEESIESSMLRKTRSFYCRQEKSPTLTARGDRPIPYARPLFPCPEPRGSCLTKCSPGNVSKTEATRPRSEACFRIFTSTIIYRNFYSNIQNTGRPSQHTRPQGATGRASGPRPTDTLERPPCASLLAAGPPPTLTPHVLKVYRVTRMQLHGQ